MNDRITGHTTGKYPDSWYAATAPLLPAFPSLRGEEVADVCVIGGGYTGLSTAIHLRKRGYDVVLLEAERIGWGASGRNGGHVGTGQRVDQARIEQWVGLDTAKALRSSCPGVVFKNSKTVFSGWNASGIKVTKPFVLSCSSRNRTK